MNLINNNAFIIENLEIKDYRRFKNISRLEEDFRRFNLIYGWNYSGKTTLSRIFANFNGQIKNDSEVKEGEYCLIKRENQEKLTQDNSDKLLVHTFNSDYIKNNIFFESYNLNNILILADRVQEIVQEIRELENKKENINKEIEKYKNQDEEFSKIYNECRSVCAKTICDTISQHRFTAKNLPSIENRLDKSDLTQYILDSDTINAFSKTIRSQNIYNHIQFGLILDNINLDKLNELLRKSVTPSDVLSRLQSKNAENWVKEGLDLHRQTQEQQCLFCGSNLSENRLNELDEIFKSEYDSLGSSLIESKCKFNKIEIKTEVPANIAECFRDNYMEWQSSLETALSNYNNRLSALQKIINAKLLKRDIKMSANVDLNTYQKRLQDCIDKIAALIKKHNEFIKNEIQEKQKLIEKIENHYVAQLLLSPNYIDADKNIQDAKLSHAESRKNLQIVLTDIEKLKAKISDTHKGAESINYYLSVLFLGQPTVQLKVISKTDTNGKEIFVTQLFRGDKPADNLSDGEKTSIAFAHYLAKINISISIGTADKEILYIDDPISSLDQNHIYSVSTIINRLRDKFNQVFVSTHNFELYKLLSLSCQTKDKTNQYNEIIKFARDRFFYIKRVNDKSIICKIPKALIEFKSEYNFLFYNLKEFLDDPSEDQIFLIGHCARRFLEIYLSSRYPNTKKLDQKLKDFAIDNNIYEIEMSILYRIINDESHTHSEKSFDKSSTVNAVEKIMEILIHCDKTHYECLENSLSENKTALKI